MRVLMHPQPIWEETPTLGDNGKWGGRHRTCGWGWNGPEEGEEVDEHNPPSPEFRPICEDGIMWYWTDEQEQEAKHASS